MKQNIHEYLAEFDDIPGTRVYTTARARKGYWVNQFAMSLMKDENRKRWLADEKAYLQAVSTMTGMSVEEYRNMMLSGGRSPEGLRSKKKGY